MTTIEKLVLKPAVGPRADRPVLHTHRLTGEFDHQLTDALAFGDALRIQSAEFWLMLGLPDRASRELEHLSRHAARHPWALRTQMMVVSNLTLI